MNTLVQVVRYQLNTRIDQHQCLCFLENVLLSRMWQDAFALFQSHPHSDEGSDHITRCWLSSRRVGLVFIGFSAGGISTRAQRWHCYSVTVSSEPSAAFCPLLLRGHNEPAIHSIHGQTSWLEPNYTTPTFHIVILGAFSRWPNRSLRIMNP